ncbi:hypothetical protein L3Q82_025858, partial [Scortum barcoo]
MDEFLVLDVWEKTSTPLQPVETAPGEDHDSSSESSVNSQLSPSNDRGRGSNPTKFDPVFSISQQSTIYQGAVGMGLRALLSPEVGWQDATLPWLVRELFSLNQLGPPASLQSSQCRPHGLTPTLKVSLDEISEVDRDKKMRCGEKAKEEEEEEEKRRAGARCWEVQVTWWAPGPRGGVVFICTPVSRPTLSSPLSSLSAPQVDFKQRVWSWFFGKVQIEPYGREEQGAAISHDRSMVGQRSSKGLLLKSSILAWPYPSALPLWPISPGAPSLPSHLCPHLSNLSGEQAQSGINSHVTGNPHCFDTSGYDKKVYYTAVISITAEQLGLREAQNGGRQAEEIGEGGGGD